MAGKSHWSVYDDIPTEAGIRVFLRNGNGTHLIDVTLTPEKKSEVLEYVNQQEWSTAELLHYLRQV